MAGSDNMRISWVTDDDTPSTVSYGTSPGSNQSSATGTSASYRYLMYKSGQIHDVEIGPLKPSTVYYYRCGGSDEDTTGGRELNFRTPPAQFPINFVVAGDLGQTEWTASTLSHIAASNYDVLILPGDLSYADLDQRMWDSFGRLVEPLASNRPWMVTQGNHEVEKLPILHREKFTSYNARWRMPFDVGPGRSGDNLYYSFDVAGVHVAMLGSYTDFGAGSAQYVWLEADLGTVDRGTTPWVVVVIHAPWYNSNTAHQGEKEAVDMKASMEGLLYKARVDIVFAGHVHAYERFGRVFNDRADNCGPVHIVIGDGGNREGLASEYQNPQPSTSIFREASFGHGRFEVANETHALWTWHRNDDSQAIIADSLWLRSLAFDPTCKSSR